MTPATSSPAGLDAEGRRFLHDLRREALRYAFLTRCEDPLATFEGVRVLYAPPRSRRPGEPWLPVVSALRSLRDIVRATDFAPGRLVATGHDYYLTYHRYATREQVERCHPRFGEFLRLKREHDPDGLLTSDWHAHHERLLAGDR